MLLLCLFMYCVTDLVGFLAELWLVGLVFVGFVWGGCWAIWFGFIGCVGDLLELFV